MPRNGTSSLSPAAAAADSQMPINLNTSQPVTPSQRMDVLIAAEYQHT